MQIVKMQDLSKITRILVVNLGGIGDVLLSSPALRALRQQFPRAHLATLVVPRSVEVMENLSCADTVFVFNKNYNAIALLKNVFTLLELRSRNFDIAINMRTLVSQTSAQKIKYLLRIIRPRISAGRDTEKRGGFFSIKIPETEGKEKYEMEYDIDVVEALGVKVSDRTISLAIGKKAQESSNNILLKENVADKDLLVGIHPGGLRCHRWPIEYFSRLINELHKKERCIFAITGSRDEAGLARRLKRATNARVIDFTGRINFQQLTALIKRYDLLISNDTGPMHIAAILKTPLLAIFGPGYLNRYDPRHISNKAFVFHKAAACAPCTKTDCKQLKCLTVIFPDEVIQKALEILGSKI